MKTNLPRSAYISKQDLSKKEAKTLVKSLIGEGFCHFYLKNEVKSPLIDELLKFKDIFGKIKIFIVHDSKLGRLPDKIIVNLPVYAPNGDEDVDAWLEKYCEKVN